MDKETLAHEVMGCWKSEKGDGLLEAFEFFEDGTFNLSIVCQGSIFNLSYGTYEITGDKITTQHVKMDMHMKGLGVQTIPSDFKNTSIWAIEGDKLHLGEVTFVKTVNLSLCSETSK